MTEIKLQTKTKNQEGTKINHPKYGKGLVVGIVGGGSYRVQFESGEVRDFMDTILLEYVDTE